MARLHSKIMDLICTLLVGFTYDELIYEVTNWFSCSPFIVTREPPLGRHPLSFAPDCQRGWADVQYTEFPLSKASNDDLYSSVCP